MADKVEKKVEKVEKVEKVKPLNLSQKLQKIQYEMKAPKNLFNNFGKYKYRNAESILEAFKPYGKKYECFLTISDSIDFIGNRFYVCADAQLHDCATDDMVSVCAYAREEEMKKGMDGSQITGSASSYARKYALNGLFLLDDTKDSDTDEQQQERTARSTKVQLATPEQVKLLSQLYSTEELKSMCVSKGVPTIRELSAKDAAIAINYRKEQ